MKVKFYVTLEPVFVGDKLVEVKATGIRKNNPRVSGAAVNFVPIELSVSPEMFDPKPIEIEVESKQLVEVT